MDQLVHLIGPLVLAVIVASGKLTRGMYWRVVALLVILPPVVGVLAGSRGTISGALLNWTLIFALPMLVAAVVGIKVAQWRRRGLGFLAIPSAYFATLVVTLVIGVNAGVLAP